MDSQALEQKYFFKTFTRQPITVVKARGGCVWDDQGRRYLDFYSGLAVCGVGHNHPAVVKAIALQVKKLIHCSNFFVNEPAVEFAAALCRRTGLKKVFFSNSGAEANECSVKIARKWGHLNKGKKAHEVIVFENAFHGRTLAMISATPQKRIQQHFEPLLEGFKVAKLNDLTSVQRRINRNTCAVWVETIQGEGGIRVASKKFLQELEKLCRKNKALLMLDEVQSGMGRTGTFFAYEAAGVKPDVVAVAKGVAGGVPLGVTLGADSVADVFVPGDHGSTFGGNPVACAAGLAVLSLLTPQALKHNREMGSYIFSRLHALAKKHPLIREVRGQGLMIGIELTVPGSSFVDSFRKQGILINCTQQNVIRFLPPYGVTRKEIDRVLNLFDHTLEFYHD